jgi:hypothetical protein
MSCLPPGRAIIACGGKLGGCPSLAHDAKPGTVNGRQQAFMHPNASEIELLVSGGLRLTVGSTRTSMLRIAAG